jgi:hypothetical protein
MVKMGISSTFGREAKQGSCILPKETKRKPVTNGTNLSFNTAILKELSNYIPVPFLWLYYLLRVQ